MAGWNPWIDTAICVAFLAALALMCYVGHKYDKHQKSKLRGATRC